MLDLLQKKTIEELKEIEKEIKVLIVEKQKEKKRELKKKFQEMAEEAGLSIEEVIQVKNTNKAKIKYKKGSETWSGRGRRPKWVVELEKSGEDLAEYSVE